MRGLLISIFILLTTLLCGQSLKFRQYQTQDGLPQISVNQILEDRNGFIWLATQDGLARFNGYEFKTYRPSPQDPDAISDNFIIHMVEDSLGRIWIATRNAINVFDPKTEKFKKITNDVSDDLQVDYLRIYQGQILFNYPRKHMLVTVPDTIDLTKPITGISEIGNIIHPGLSLANIVPLEDSILFVFGDRSWLIKENDTVVIDHNGVQASRSSFSYQVQNNVVEFGGLEHSISIDLKNKRVTLTEPPYVIHSTLKNWIGTDHGLVLKDPKSIKTAQTIPEIGNTLVHHLYEDSQSRIWIGTAGKGVFLHDPFWQQFDVFDPAKMGAQDSYANCSERIENYDYLGLNHGLLQIPLRGKSEEILLPSLRITALKKDNRNRLWIGTGRGDIWTLEHPKAEPRRIFRSEKNLRVVEFLNTTRLGLLVATYSGLMTIEEENQGWKTELIDLGYTYIMGIHEDNLGNIWVGHNSGLSVIGDKIHHIPYNQNDSRSPSFQFVSGIVTLKNQIWIATYGGGLNRMNVDSTFTYFDETNGLANNVIHDLAVDQTGSLWMTTNSGISTFDPNTEEFVNFDDCSGLTGSTFPIASIQKSGNLFRIGSSEGLVTFNPMSIQRSVRPPDLHIEDFQINYAKRKIPDDDIELFADDKVITFGFVANDYSNPEGVAYSYMLKGFDEHWVKVSSGSRRLTYSSLPVGQYELILRACSQNNLWRPVTRSFSIRVYPPIWLRPEFYLPTLAFIIGSFSFLIYWLSRRKLKRRVKELEMQKKIQNERERISRDLHDSVGTHFAYIVSKLDFLYLGWSNGDLDEKKAYLGALGDFARSGMRMLRETIWALNDVSVSGNSLKSKISDYLNLCFETEKEAAHEFNFECLVDKVNSNVALNLFRMIQESVSNSLKHAKASRISIEMRVLDSDSFSMTISDNGMGFDLADGHAKEDHYGLKNLEARAKEISAQCHIQSNSLGTTIKVSTE